MSLSTEATCTSSSASPSPTVVSIMAPSTSRSSLESGATSPKASAAELGTAAWASTAGSGAGVGTGSVSFSTERGRAATASSGTGAAARRNGGDDSGISAVLSTITGRRSGGGWSIPSGAVARIAGAGVDAASFGALRTWATSPPSKPRPGCALGRNRSNQLDHVGVAVRAVRPPMTTATSRRLSRFTDETRLNPEALM